MNPKSGIIDNEIVVYADASLFSKDAVFKCLYWYTNKYHTQVSIDPDNNYKISVKPLNKEALNHSELEYIFQRLQRDLIDFNLRDIVTKETQNIRDLLTAKAFSNGEFDELPPGDLTDPVGFDITQI